MNNTFVLLTEADTLTFAKQFAHTCTLPHVIYLQGPLGAGKTTFVRGFLQGLGFSGKVKSPSYTLVEPYSINNLTVYHFDLYRIKAPEELETLGMRDYIDNHSLLLIEWPEHGKKYLPAADIICEFQIEANRRILTVCNQKP